MAERGTGVSDDDEGDESQPETPRIVPLTAAKISEWNSALEKIFNDMEECDPMLERSLTFKRLTSTAFIPYAETLKDLRRKAKQTRLKEFFKPVWEGTLLTPSPGCESQTPGVEPPDLTCQPHWRLPLLPSKSRTLLWFSRGQVKVSRFNPTALCPITKWAPQVRFSFVFSQDSRCFFSVRCSRAWLSRAVGALCATEQERQSLHGAVPGMVFPYEETLHTTSYS